MRSRRSRIRIAVGGTEHFGVCGRAENRLQNVCVTADRQFAFCSLPWAVGFFHALVGQGTKEGGKGGNVHRRSAGRAAATRGESTRKRHRSLGSADRRED